MAEMRKDKQRMQYHESNNELERGAKSGSISASVCDKKPRSSIRMKSRVRATGARTERKADGGRETRTLSGGRQVRGLR